MVVRHAHCAVRRGRGSGSEAGSVRGSRLARERTQVPSLYLTLPISLSQVSLESLSGHLDNTVVISKLTQRQFAHTTTNAGHACSAKISMCLPLIGVELIPEVPVVTGTGAYTGGA